MISAFAKMASITIQKLLSEAKLLTLIPSFGTVKRSIVQKQSGAFYTQPKKVPLGVIRVVVTVFSGLLVGAGISKGIANFLEENDLFVPSDDDDDDD